MAIEIDIPVLSSFYHCICLFPSIYEHMFIICILHCRVSLWNAFVYIYCWAIFHWLCFINWYRSIAIALIFQWNTKLEKQKKYIILFDIPSKKKKKIFFSLVVDVSKHVMGQKYGKLWVMFRSDQRLRTMGELLKLGGNKQ